MPVSWLILLYTKYFGVWLRLASSVNAAHSKWAGVRVYQWRTGMLRIYAALTRRLLSHTLT